MLQQSYLLGHPDLNVALKLHLYFVLSWEQTNQKAKKIYQYIVQFKGRGRVLFTSCSYVMMDDN